MKSTNFMGGGARNVTFRDSAIRNTLKQAFIFTLDYNDPNAKLDYRRSTIAGQFKDIRVSNVSVENAQGSAIEVKGDSQHNAYHQGLIFQDVRFRGAAGARIDGLKDSRFERVVFSEHGNANPWQVTGSSGLSFKDVQPSPN
jgi:exo-poly-alpha-galacturonosidase